ncbi:MAG TPA: hypothetical protein VGA66_18470 [Mycobacterium sp.]
MRPRLALSIGAAFNVLAGLPILLATAQFFSVGGWPTAPDVALVPARDAGTLLIVLGIINWLGRGAEGAPLRGLLWGNILRPAASIVVNSWEYAAGILPATVVGGLVAAIVVDIALIVMFALALRRTDSSTSSIS